MATNRIVRLLLTGLFTLSLLALWGRSTVRAQGNTLDDRGQAGLAALSPTLADQLAHASEPVSFLIILDEQLDSDAILADLARTDQRRIGRESKADAIYRTLSTHATRTQAPLRTWLDAQGVDYRPFYIVNMIEVHGDARLAQALRQRPDVNRLAANPIVSAQLDNALPQPGWLRAWTDPRPEATTALPWGLTYTNADDLWALGHTGEGIVIGDQDTGVEWDHNALKARYRGWFTDTQTVEHVYNWFDAWGVDGRPARCSTNPQVPCDDHGHGTHTVGTLMGDATGDGYEQLGMAPDATWIGCRNMRNGFGTPASYAACFQFFLAPYPQNGDPFVDGRPDLAPHIISNSWGCPDFEGCDQDSLRTVVETTRAAGQLIVASAGNDGFGCSTVQNPIAIHDATFTIGAHSSNGVIAAFSSRGPVIADGSGRLKPDISAPGVGVFSAWVPGAYRSASGTSMAGPHVAGGAALLWSAVPALIGEIDLTEQVLIKSATPVPVSDCSGGATAISPNNVYGFGRMDVLAAVQMAQAPGSVEVTLLDLVGQPIGQADITLIDALTGYVFTAQIAANGIALIPTVFAGEYALGVAAGGVDFPPTALTLAPNEDVQLTLQATADYEVGKTRLTPDPVRIGSEIRFAIQITNTGAVSLTTLTLTDTFDSRYLGYEASDTAPDAVTIDGAQMGHLRWDDLTATFNRDLASGARFDLTVTFRGLQDTSALPSQGSTENVIMIGDVWASPGGGGDVAIPITRSAGAFAAILAPTAVLIDADGVEFVADGVDVYWATVSEENLRGFHLHRRVDDGDWAPLTVQLISAASPNPTQGHVYHYLDSLVLAATRYGYALEVLALDDTTRWVELGTVGAQMEIYLPLIRH